MRTLYIIFGFCLGAVMRLSAQSTSIGKYMPSDHGIGIELTAPFESYSGPRFSYYQYLKNNILLRAQVLFVTESNPKVGGYDVRLEGGIAVVDRIIAITTGYYRAESTMTEDVILDRLGGSFFQEVDVQQDRTDSGGFISVNLCPMVDRNVLLVFENTLLYGRETIKALSPSLPSSSVFVQNQDVDRRLVVNSSDRLQTRFWFDFNLSVVWLF